MRESNSLNQLPNDSNNFKLKTIRKAGTQPICQRRKLWLLTWIAFFQYSKRLTHIGLCTLLKYCGIRTHT